MIGGSRKRRHHSKPGPRLDPTRLQLIARSRCARPSAKAPVCSTEPIMRCGNVSNAASEKINDIPTRGSLLIFGFDNYTQTVSVGLLKDKQDVPMSVTFVLMFLILPRLVRIRWIWLSIITVSTAGAAPRSCCSFSCATRKRTAVTK